MKYWKQIVIVVLLIVVGVLFAQMCKRSPQANFNPQVTIDSLKKENIALISRDREKSDSIDAVVTLKNSRIAEMEKSIQSISARYAKIKNQIPPDRDTVVNEIKFVEGEECLEKLPIIQAKVVTLESVVEDLKTKCAIKDSTNMTLQRQFDRSIQLNITQKQEAEKQAKKGKWQKRGMWAGLIIGIGGIIYGMTR